MFIIKSTKTDAIICQDGEPRASCLVGPLGFRARIYKTRAGAERAVNGNSWRKVVELDKNGCEVRAR
jgi:hypothetical protein